MTDTSSSDGTPQPGATKRRALAVLGAVVAALIIWFLATVVFGVDLQAAQGGGSEPEKIGIREVIVTSLGASLLGWALLAILERFVARARTIWLVIAVVALLMSFGGPLDAGVGTASKITLAAMHVAVAAVIIPNFTGTSRRR